MRNETVDEIRARLTRTAPHLSAMRIHRAAMNEARAQLADRHRAYIDSIEQD